MNPAQILQLYMIQSDNVRHLWQVKCCAIQDINRSLRKNDLFQVSFRTKILSILYSAWSEAQFLQIAYTPDGFDFAEIVAIKAEKDGKGIAAGWKYMLELAMTKVGDVNRNKDINTRLARLLNMVSEYIEEPSIIRNKLAHGQWKNALNRDNTSKNIDLSAKIANLDPVIIEKKFEIHRFLGYIVRDLVQSPKAGFHNHYWTNMVNLEEYLNRTINWNSQTKALKLQAKRKRPET